VFKCRRAVWKTKQKEKEREGLLIPSAGGFESWHKLAVVITRKIAVPKSRLTRKKTTSSTQSLFVQKERTCCIPYFSSNQRPNFVCYQSKEEIYLKH
jgi:hypothetical protein